MSEHEVISPVQDGPEDPGDETSSAFAEAFADTDPENQEEAPTEPHDSHASPSTQADEDIPEDLRKAGQKYDSMEGRLRKEREELERKAREYENIKSQLQIAQEERRRITEALIEARQQPAQAAPAQQQLPIAEISEDVRDEAEVFAKEYPELSPLLFYPGREGQKLRKLLKDYGADVAATHGNSVMANYKMAQTETQVRQQFQAYDHRTQQQQQEMQARLENERRQAHYHQIYSAVPDYAAIATDPSRRADLETFHARLSDWVESKPHREAARMLDILRQGDARSVVTVLSQFQSENHQSARPSDARRSAARAATAIPSRASAPPRGAPDPHDTQGAFREAFG